MSRADRVRAALATGSVAWSAVRFSRGDGEDLARVQRARLRDLVAHARAASPYYRRLYRGLPPDTDELRLLPPVRKRDLMAHFDEWVTDPEVTLAALRRDWLEDPSRVGGLYLGRYHVATTSGVSGEPAVLVHDARSWALWFLVGQRGASPYLPARRIAATVLREGLGEGLRTAAVFATGGHYGAAVTLEDTRRRSRFLAGRLRMFSALRPLPELVAELNDFRPTVLEGYPSAVALLAAEQRAGRLRIRPFAVVTAGEDLSAAARADIESTFGCRVENRYAATEVPGLAMQCPAGLFHVNADWYLLEPVDAQLRPVPAGVTSHTALVTNLGNRVQPLVRYDLGDSVRAVDGPCPCGSRLPAVTVHGRAADVVELAAADRGTVNVLPLALGAVLEETPGVRRFQVVRTGPQELTVRLEPSLGADEVAVRRAVDDRLAAFLSRQGVAPVRVVHDPEPPCPDPRSGKFRQVLSS